MLIKLKWPGTRTVGEENLSLEGLCEVLSVLSPYDGQLALCLCW